MSEQTMLERVALAIQTKLDAEFAERGGLSAEEMACFAARAAIEAMRVPDFAMCRVVAAQWGNRTWRQYADVIDAALEGK